MSKQLSMTKKEKEDKRVPFDIEERTFQFGVNIVKFVRIFPRTIDAMEIGRQLIRSGLSIGANVEEASGSVSKKDFIYKISIARKESRESRYWLKIAITTNIGNENEAKSLYSESDELVRILSTIISKTNKSITK